jgi:CLIP-associating protein 1/2
MEKQAAELLAVISNDRITDAVKLDLLTKLRSRVKHHALPEHAVGIVFQVVRAALDVPSLQDASFSILSNCAKRMVLQDQHEILAVECNMTLSNILQCFASVSSRVRQRAVQSLVDLWSALHSQGDSATRIERAVKQRAETEDRVVILTALDWLQRIQQEYPTQFKPQNQFLPLVVSFLASGDEEVSSAAETAIYRLFGHSESAIKNLLKRELLNSDISRRLRDAVFTECGIRPISAGSDTSRRSSSVPRRPLSRPQSSHQPHSSLSHTQTSSNLNSTTAQKTTRPLSTSKSFAALSSVAKKENVHPERVTMTNGHGETSRKVTRTPAPALDSADPLPPAMPAATRAELDPAQPINIDSNGTFFLSKHLTADHQDVVSKLDEQPRLMAPVFEGRESEQNWSLREKNLIIMRKITKGNGPSDFRNAYVAMIRGNLDGILRSTASLRTSMQKNGCYLIQEAVQAVGPGLDPIVEFAMQTLLKLSSDTKSIAAEHANSTITIILNHVSYKSSLLQHVLNAATNKNQRPRLYAQGWMNNIISRHVNHKSTLEHGNGLENIEKVINKGLSGT